MTTTIVQRNDSVEEEAPQLRFSDVRLSTGVRLRYAEQDALASVLRNASLKVYTETGHALHWERPEQFVKDLKEFIRP